MMDDGSAGRGEILRLHVGGLQVKAGWKILNIQAGPGVDFVGSCLDLEQFADNSVAEVYASHVFEHLDYHSELLAALKGIRRILAPGGILRFSVPDWDILCRLFVLPELTAAERFYVIRMMIGGQVDAHDYHKCALTMELAADFLRMAGFKEWRRVPFFGLFDDTSALQYKGVAISLNVMAVK